MGIPREIPSCLTPDAPGPWGVAPEQIDRDDGGLVHCNSYRVQHNTSRGFGKGGVRVKW